MGDLANEVTDYVLNEVFRAKYPSTRGAKVRGGGGGGGVGGEEGGDVDDCCVSAVVGFLVYFGLKGEHNLKGAEGTNPLNCVS